MNNLLIGLAIPMLPIIIAFLLPRKKTIGYGVALYKIIGTMLAQLGSKVQIAPTTWGKIVEAIRKTFVDLSFGIYLGSITDVTKANEKLKEYIG